MALTAEQMAAMSRLLDQALELDEAGRERWLRALDPAYRELEPALRQALLGGEPGLGTAPYLTELDPAALAGGLKAGDLVGPYRLVRPLGRGGMAQVWLAQRADGAYQRDVALKLPATVLRQDLASRFARERDILAKLEHPNIARLYDAGVSSQGQPYLAMEWVAGEPLIDWCDAQRLGVQERLKMFLQVLEAVQYAHGKQVIHRDLKPSNILVTGSGQVRLLDFGVAKLMRQTDDATELTRIYGRVLTPQYASPEQLRGEEVTAASDVYALGVLLYELLAGSRPYKLDETSPALLEQVIASAQVPAPSRRVGADAALARSTSSSQLSRHLQGDLDAIVLKALAKDRAERYRSATALAEDLRRYLTGEPVQARPYTPLYRLTKFVVRHRTGVLLNAVATVVVIGAAVQEVRNRPAPGPGQAAASATSTAASPAAPATAARTVAVDDKSIAVLPFVDMSEKHDQEYFSDGLSEELIDRLAHSPDLKVIARTSAFAFKGKNEDMRTIAARLGVAHLLEGSVRKSGNELRITAQLIRASDGSHLWSQTYDRRLADVFKVQDDIAGTVAQALQVAMNVGTKGPPGGTEAADAYNLVLRADYLNRRAYNKPTTLKAIEVYRQAISLDPHYALAWAKMAMAYDNLEDFEPDPQEVGTDDSIARSALDRALKIDPNLATAHDFLGWRHLHHDWNWGAARQEFDRARELDPSNVHLPGNYARLAQFFGRFDEAIALYRQVLARDPLDTGTWSRLAQTFLNAGRFDESVDTWHKLLVLDPNVPAGNYLLAVALLNLGRSGEALAAARRETNEEYRLAALAIVFWNLGQRRESNDSLVNLESRFGKSHPFNIAIVHAYRGEKDAAFEWLERAYARRDPIMPVLKVSVLANNLHGDPRYDALLVRMKLVD